MERRSGGILTKAQQYQQSRDVGLLARGLGNLMMGGDSAIEGVDDVDSVSDNEWDYGEAPQPTVPEVEKPPFSYTILEEMRMRRRKKASTEKVQEKNIWKSEQKRKSIMAINTPTLFQECEDKEETSQNGWQMRRECVLDRVSILFNNPIMSDVLFRIENKAIPAHKFMLAASSPVFYSSFYETMAQSRKQSLAHSHRDRKSTFVAPQIPGGSQIIEINDISASAFFEFIRFLYTDEVTVTLDNVQELIMLADDYRVAGLHEQCMEYFRTVVVDPKESFRCLGLLRRIFLKQVLEFWRDLVESHIMSDDRVSGGSRPGSAVYRPASGSGSTSVRPGSALSDRRPVAPGSRCNSACSVSSRQSKATTASSTSNPGGFTFSARGRQMSYKLSLVIKDLNVLCWHAIERSTEDALVSPGFLESDQPIIRMLLERKKSSVPEIAIFRAIVRWTDAECRRRGLSPGLGHNRREVLGDMCVRHIRFPAMTKDQLQWEVVPSGLLCFDDVSPLLHYMDSPAAALLRFGVNPREGGEDRDLPVNKERQSLHPLRPTTPMLDPKKDDEIDRLLSSALFRAELRRQNEGSEVNRIGLLTRRLPGAYGGVSQRVPKKAEDFERVGPGLYRHEDTHLLRLCIEGGEVMVYELGSLHPGEPVDVEHYSRLAARGHGMPLSAFL